MGDNLKYKIPTSTFDCYWETLERLLQCGYCFGADRHRSVKAVKNQYMMTYDYILIGYYRGCSMQLSACDSSWLSRNNFRAVGLDEFLALSTA